MTTLGTPMWGADDHIRQAYVLIYFFPRWVKWIIKCILGVKFVYNFAASNPYISKLILGKLSIIVCTIRELVDLYPSRCTYYADYFNIQLPLFNTRVVDQDDSISTLCTKHALRLHKNHLIYGSSILHVTKAWITKAHAPHFVKKRTFHASITYAHTKTVHYTSL